MQASTIIIPIYYEDPTIIDKKSIMSLMYNLEDINDYDINFICPKMDTSKWKELVSKGKNTYFNMFKDENFKSTITYSKMMKSYDFWKTFFNYDFALIYQTDGYCIGGSLKTYIDMDYDYIGAPIVSHNARWFNVPAIGNGGVSLRKVSTMMEVTDPDGEFMLDSKEDIARHNQMNGDMYDVYEDLYFAQLVPMLWDFSKPSFDIASHFAYDMNADAVYEMTSHRLPLFIHAYDKNIRFWQNIIPDLNDINVVSECEWNHRLTWFSPERNYQGNLSHQSINVAAIIPVKNENWRLQHTIEKLIDNGVKKVIIVDNNDLNGENPRDSFTKLFNDVSIEFIDKFRGKRFSEDYDLLSEMYLDAYMHYCSDVNYVLFIDADEELHVEEGKTIRDIAYSMQDKGYDMMHIPCFDLNCQGEIEYKASRKKIKTLMKTGLPVLKFFRETPVIERSCCDNEFNSASSLDRTYHNENDMEHIYITNDATGTLRDFYDHKIFRGWPDKPYSYRKRDCGESYYYMFNDKNSTITIE